MMSTIVSLVLYQEVIENRWIDRYTETDVRRLILSFEAYKALCAPSLEVAHKLTFYSQVYLVC